MGALQLSLYTAANGRGSDQDACTEVRQLWLDRKRKEAIEAVPDEMVWGTMLIGDEARVRERIRLYRDAGSSELMLHPAAPDTAGRLDMLGRAVEIVGQETS